MKLLLTGDSHITDKTPINRTERDFLEVCFNKWRFIFKMAEKHDVRYIIQPGDFFDTPFLSYESFERVCAFLYESCNNQIITIYGQHDMRYRHRENTPLNAITTALPEMFRLIDEGVFNYESTSERVCFVGASFGRSIMEAPEESDFTVLIIHRMLTDEKLWAGQTDYTPASIFMRQQPFDLIVSGDNHHPFHKVTKDKKPRHLANCGALVRDTTNLLNHEPHIVLFDTVKRTKEIINVPIDPIETAFQMSKIKIAKERDASIEAFVSGLTQQKDVGLNFEEVLQNIMDENDIDDEVREIINESKYASA